MQRPVCHAFFVQTEVPYERVCLECYVATIPSMRWAERFKSCILNISWPSKGGVSNPGGCMSNPVKIVRFHKTGPAEVLQFDELPLPEPGPGEIRLRIKALGLNRAEVMFRNGQYLETPILPSKNGYEAAGIIEAAGPGVDSSLIGKTVSTVPGTFKLNDHGVYGEV